MNIFAIWALAVFGYLLIAVATATVMVATMTHKGAADPGSAAFGFMWPVVWICSALYWAGKGLAWLIWHGAHKLNPNLRAWTKTT